MNRIYSDLGAALSQAENYMLAKETDVYLCHCRYPSGVEYSFRTEKDISFTDSPTIIKIYSLPIWHLFKKKGNALKAKKKFEQAHECKLKIKRTKMDNNEYVYTLSHVQ